MFNLPGDEFRRSVQTPLLNLSSGHLVDPFEECEHHIQWMPPRAPVLSLHEPSPLGISVLITNSFYTLRDT
jgi:hypothetical protein